MSKHVSVYGLYPDPAAVHDAAAALEAAGFKPTDISVLVPDNVGSKDFAHEKHSKAPEGAAVGGSAGGAIGAVLGYLAAVGAFALPGFEGFAAAGPIVGTLGGLGAGAALGGISGGLVGMGVPEYEAKRYEGRIRDGGILLAVHCGDSHWTGPAKSILKRTGARGIGVRSESSAQRPQAAATVRRPS